MRALVVYESMFGNTRQVARAIGEGLATTMQVVVIDVGDLPTPSAGHVDLVVVGGPTHAFSMSRQSTRDDAIAKGAPRVGTGTGIREWLDSQAPGPHPELVATFDTRVDKVRHLPGSAAKGAARSARRHGYAAAAPPESFYVHDTDGPLLDGELDRARAWGEKLGREASAAPSPKES